MQLIPQKDGTILTNGSGYHFMEIIGHRGARKEAPENTVESFIHAQNNGCFHFELDVRLSSDRSLMVYHDKTLKRTSGIKRKVIATSSKVLRHTDARFNTPGWPKPCYIPLLKDVVDAVPNTLSWQFEVKPDSHYNMKVIIKKLSHFIMKHKLNDKVVATSSSKWFLKEMKRFSPHIKTGYVAAHKLHRPVSTCIALDCDLLVLHEELISPSLLRHAELGSIEVSCWTVNELDRMMYLKELGIKSLITDIPTTAIKHFAKP